MIYFTLIFYVRFSNIILVRYVVLKKVYNCRDELSLLTQRLFY
jgi:hypothetical protein